MKILTVNKLLVALVGLAVNYLGKRWGVDSAAYDDLVFVLTAIGVYAVPNKPTA